MRHDNEIITKSVILLFTNKLLKRNLVFATNSNVPIYKSLHSDGVNIRHFKLRLFYLTAFVV